jgi:NitT/TauT family transport system substrate-binding protein
MKPITAWFLVADLMCVLALGACTTGTQTPAAASTARPTSAATAAPVAPTPAPPAAPTTGVSTETSVIASYSELTPINLPVWIAEDQGLFKKHGLRVDLRYIESSLGVSALLASEEQFAGMGGSETLAAAVNGADLEVLACLSPVYPYKLEVVSSIQTVEDLRGKKLGVSRFGSSSDSATRAALRQVGLNADTDVTLVQVGSLAARTAALLSGSLDGAVTALPDTLVLEEKGLHPLLDLAEQQLPAVNNVLVARKSWVSSHQEVTQAYVDAVVEGVARAKADKPLSLKLIQQFLKERAGDATQMSAAYDFDILEVMQMPPITRANQFADALSDLTNRDPRISDFDVNTIIDNSFVESAVARGLGKFN